MSKKAAKNQPKEQTYEIREVVLAKVRGFPAWPGMVVDPDSVPPGVAKERPNAKSKKGNWYCVQFFPAGDYAWIVPKDMSKLQTHEIQAYIDEPFKRSGELLAGYKVALNPKKWEEEREAQRAEAAEAEANAEVDQLEDSEAEGEDEEEEKPKNKKRKRDSEPAAAKSKPKAKAKKEPAEPKKKATASAKGKKNGVKSKALVESEDDAGAEDEDAGPSKKTSPPPTKKQKRDKDEDEGDAALIGDPEAIKVRDWRHKLQKAFLGKTVPKEEDMPGLDQLFTVVEQYQNMSIAYLTFSKIGKVMRHIHALAPEKAPRDNEFNFRERAKALVEKWHEILSASKTPADSAVRKPATNGKAHTEEPGEKAKENGKAESPVQDDAKAEADDMELDKKDSTVDAEAEAEAEAEADAPAEADDAPADGVADESTLADVTMSEVAAETA